jgi:hypothetical protein
MKGGVLQPGKFGRQIRGQNSLFYTLDNPNAPDTDSPGNVENRESGNKLFQH